MPESEIAVIGLGAMGGAALYHLARQGVKAVGFEQYRVGHAWGSSHGHSRVFRIFYEDLLYVNLVEAALPLWQDLEQRCGQSLLTLNGMLIYARPDNIHFAQNLEAVATTQTAHELLTPAEVSRRFPALRLPEEAVACYTPRAGFVDAGGAVKAQVDQARRLGATVYEQAQVQQIDWTGERPELVTTAGRFRCERLIITPGPWAANILADLALPLQVTRQQKFYFRPHNPSGRHFVFASTLFSTGGDALYQPDRLPIYADYDRQFYGFPNYGPGLKVADDIPVRVQPADGHKPNRLEYPPAPARDNLPESFQPYRRPPASLIYAPQPGGGPE